MPRLVGGSREIHVFRQRQQAYEASGEARVGQAPRGLERTDEGTDEPEMPALVFRKQLRVSLLEEGVLLLRLCPPRPSNSSGVYVCISIVNDLRHNTWTPG